MAKWYYLKRRGTMGLYWQNGMISISTNGIYSMIRSFIGNSIVREIVKWFLNLKLSSSSLLESLTKLMLKSYVVTKILRKCILKVIFSKILIFAQNWLQLHCNKWEFCQMIILLVPSGQVSLFCICTKF